MISSRRTLLFDWLLGTVLGHASLGGIGVGVLSLVGCSAPRPPPPVRPKPRAQRISVELTALLPAAGLEWAVLLQPALVSSTEWLRAPLGRILRDERLDMLVENTGLDLRVAPEIVVASYGPPRGEPEGSIAYFVRHATDATAVERKFRARLTSHEERFVIGHQLVRVWGRIGTREHGFVSVGSEVAGYQYGGSKMRGPVRIAELFARGLLASVPTLLALPTTRAMHQVVAGAPVEILFPGPFEGDMAHGARGLMAVADGAVVALRPTSNRTLQLWVVLSGDFSERGDEARRLLEAAWTDLAESDVGHLLALHAPKTLAMATLAPPGLQLTCELDATGLLDGLAAATVDDVREIMK